MAEILSSTYAKLEQMRSEQNSAFAAILAELRATHSEQVVVLNYIVDILRDIRMGLSLALGEDLSSYSESLEGNVVGDESTL